MNPGPPTCDLPLSKSAQSFAPLQKSRAHHRKVLMSYRVRVLWRWGEGGEKVDFKNTLCLPPKIVHKPLFSNAPGSILPRAFEDNNKGCVRLGNLDLAFKIRISDLQSNANPQTDFNAEIYVFGFPFYRSIGKSEKAFKKLSFRTAVMHAHA